ncbi:MAG: hypothetical protein OXG27_13190 [Chloroflexi bacterium]|nr:hypothetical protein [Chloroflexota bacterium]
MTRFGSDRGPQSIDRLEREPVPTYAPLGMGTHDLGKKRQLSGDFIHENLARVLPSGGRMAEGQHQLLAVHKPVSQLVPLGEKATVVVLALAVDDREVSMPWTWILPTNSDRIGFVIEILLNESHHGLRRWRYSVE